MAASSPPSNVPKPTPTQLHLANPTPPRHPNVVKFLEQRGLLESLTSKNLRLACSNPSLPPLKIYCGFDRTAESLHLGNLLGIIVFSWFQRCGHQVVALIGGSTTHVGDPTTHVGDPSRKSLERLELDSETLLKNQLGVTDNITRILVCGSKLSSVVVLNNFDCWKDVKLLDFLTQVGRFARVGTMMAKESKEEVGIGTG